MSEQIATTPFLYVAVNEAGSRRLGVRAAGSEAVLAGELGEDRMLLLRAWALPGWTARRSGVSLGDQAALNRQLATLLDRGVPLVESLEVAASVVSPPSQDRLKKLREEVSAGASFAEACVHVGGFDDISIAVYRAAEKTGDLGPAAHRLAEAAERRRIIAGKAATLLIYPAVLMIVSVVVSLILLMGVVPRIAEALRGAGAEMPALTQVVVAVGMFLSQQWLPVLALVCGLVIAGVVWRARAVELFARGLQLIPSIRRLSLTTETARFFTVMAAMTRAGVTLADALSVATGAVTEPRLRAQLDDLQRGLVEGGAWRQLMDRVDALPLALRRLLVAAERSGDMDQALDAIALDLGREVERRTERVLAALEPAIILVMFGLVGLLMLALMLPMLNLSSGL